MVRIRTNDDVLTADSSSNKVFHKKIDVIRASLRVLVNGDRKFEANMHKTYVMTCCSSELFHIPVDIKGGLIARTMGC